MSLSKAIAYLILTIGMLNLQLGPTVIELNHLQAQTSGDAGTSDSSSDSTATASQNSTDQVQNAFDQASNSIDTETFKGEDPGSMGSFMNILIMIIIGFITMGYFFYCTKWSADLIIAAIGGAIYIAGELQELFGEKQEISGKEINYEVDGFGVIQEEEQYQALVEEKKAYESVKEAAEKKAKLQNAAVTAWTAASVLAFTFAIMEETSENICASGATIECAGVSPNKACCAAAVDVGIRKADKLTPQPSSAAWLKNTQYKSVALACATSCGFWASMLITASCACLPVQATEYKNMSHPNQPEGLYAHQKSMKNLIKDLMTKKLERQMLSKNKANDPSFINSFVDIIFPKAEAGMGELLGGLGGGLLTAYLLKKTLEIEIDLFLSGPLNRGIVFTVLTLLGKKAASTSEDIAEKMQRNIDKLDKILNRYEQFQNINDIKGTPGNANLTSVPQNLQTIGQIGTPENPFPCIVQNSQGKCVSTASAFNNSLPEGVPEFDPMTQAAITNATRAADGMSGQVNIGDSAAQGINGLSDGQAALSKRARKLQDHLDKMRKKNKQPKIPFDKLKNRFLAGTKARLRGALGKKGLTASGVVSKISPAVNSVADAEKEEKANENESTGVAMAGGAFQASSGNGNGGFKLNLGDDKSSGALPGLDLDDEDADIIGMDEELAGQDIVQDESANIFQVISVRYIKSYDKLFEQKKKEPEVD